MTTDPPTHPSPATRHAPPVLEAARALVPRIQAAADQIERERELPRPLFEALADAGLFWLQVPRSLGGGEIDFPTFTQVVEVIARADGSTAWCISQGSTFARVSAYLRPDVARQIFTGPRVVVANGAGVPGRAVPTAGGFRVSGRWAFSSGCRHATWMSGHALVMDDGQPRRRPDGAPDERWALFPLGQAQFEDNWQVAGMRGTGSWQFSVADLFVPEERTAVMAIGSPYEPGPLYRLPYILVFAAGFASVSLGIARAALDDLLDLAGAKVPWRARSTLREQASVQGQVGQAEARLRSARAFLAEAVGEAWEAVASGGVLSVEQRVTLRLAATHTMHLCREVVDLVYGAAGATAIYASNPIQRRFQDMHVATQHVQARLAHYESVGRFYLGLEPDLYWM